MNLQTKLGTIAGAVALTALSMGSAQAVDIPSDLQYSYSLDQPVIGAMSLATKGDCTQTLGSPFTLAMVGGVEEGLTTALNTANNDVTCNLDVQANSTGTTLKGTVSAASQGQSGTGTFTLVCDVGRSMRSWFHVLVSSGGDAALAPDPYGVVASGYVSCNWTIDVDDDQKSQLSGTLEMQGSFTQDSTPVDWAQCESLGLPIPAHALPRAKCIEFAMNIQAYLTGGTGAYAGRTGSGSMTQTVHAPLLIPISLDGGSTPPTPTCPTDQPDCQALDLTGCQYSPTDPGDPSWIGPIPPGAKVPGYQGPGWYKCGDSGGGTGFTGCQFSPTEQTGPGWSYINLPLPPGAPAPPGYQGPGWYNCGDPVPPGSVIVSEQSIRAAFMSAFSPKAGGESLSLSTKPGVAAPRFAAPAKTSAATIRDFSTASKTTVRISAVTGATCAVTAKAGSGSATLVKAAKVLKGQVDTKVTAAKLMTSLKAASGSQAVLTAACTTRVGAKTVKLPSASITVKFTAK